MNIPKIIVILGPTASGKSNLAVELAQKFNGEVISADSRQVYKGLDIGTGKITKEEMQGIPHYLLDIVSPKKVFTADEYKKLAEKVIAKILKKKKVPIICGGTGFYIQSIVDNIILPEVKPNPRLRSKLKNKTSEGLFAILLELDHIRAATIDPNNPHRLIRAIEIATKLGSVPPVQSKPKYESLQIGIVTDDEKLKDKIYKRFLARLDQGMIEEAKRLHKDGLSLKRMEDLGLEYRYLALYLQNKLTRDEMIEQLSREIWQYAKRQKTWFKRDQRITGFSLEQKSEIEAKIKAFLR